MYAVLLNGCVFIVEIDEHEEEHNMDLYDQTTHEPIYMNVNTKKLTNPIKVEELKEFIKNAKETDPNTIELEHAVSERVHRCRQVPLFRLVHY